MNKDPARDIWQGKVPHNAGDLWMIYFYQHLKELEK